MILIHPVTKLTLFTTKELASPDTGQVKLAEGFAELLVALRVEYGLPMRVSSCCRSTAHNKAVGGHPRSLHLMDNPVHPVDGTAALDVVGLGNAAAVLRFVRVAVKLGWSYGLGRNFVHIDRRDLAKLKPGAFGY